MNTIDITAIILGILTLLGGCGWFVSGRRHKQEVENLKADNARKYLDLVAELAEKFRELIVKPLEAEVNQLRTEVKELKDAIESINDCSESSDCPVRKRLQQQKGRR